VWICGQRKIGLKRFGAFQAAGRILGTAVIEKVIPPDPSDGDGGLFR